MDKLSIREAVKHYEVSRPTLQKALKNGKISGVQDGQGHWKIDPSELSRVYKPRKSEADNTGKLEQVNLATENTPNLEMEQLKSALALAEARADSAEQLAQERAERIEDLRRMLPAPQADKPGWLSRILTRKGS